MPCPFKICFTNKVNTICAGGQLLVTGSQGPITRVSGVRIPCPRVASPKVHGPKSQSHRIPGLGVSGLRVPGLKVSGSWISILRVLSPWSQVQVLDYAITQVYTKIIIDTKKRIIDLLVLYLLYPKYSRTLSL